MASAVIGVEGPLTYYMEIIRGILINGVGLAVLGTEISALAVISAVTLVVSSLGFSKKLG